MTDIFSKRNTFLGLAIASIYLTFSLYLVNYRIILNTLFNSSTFYDKYALLSAILTGSIQILPWYEVALITLTALFVGINTVLIIKILRKMKDQGKLKFTAGGTSLLAVAGAGCPSCGISVFSVLGISSSVLPFHGITLQILTLILLGASLLYNTKKLQQPLICKITEK